MRKLITLSLAVLMMGLSAAVVYAAVQSGDDTSSTTGTTETTETTTTTQHRERERERHRDRGDHRRADDRHADDRRADDRHEGEVRHNDAPAPGAVDVSGPCDEAEHANDPRCTGVTPRVEDDQRADDDGVNHDRGDDRGDDRGGDRGEVEDHSGPGRGGDDSGGDDSGDHSGPGHGGRDHEEDD